MLGYFFQIRRYQKIIRRWLGKGILGVGQRRGLFMPGEICILVYNQRENRVIAVESMRGYSIFMCFREKPEYVGLSLEELRLIGLKKDRKDMGLWRIFFRYNPQKPSKRKGALIQAVEAIEKYLAKKQTDSLRQAAAKANFGSPEETDKIQTMQKPPAYLPVENAPFEPYNSGLAQSAAEEENAGNN